jgi:intracellular septation protein
MQALLDFIPIIVFFAVYRLYGIYPATVAIIVAMIALIAYQWFRNGTVSKMLLFSGGAAIVLGGITLTLRNPIFIQWKPTIVYWVMAAAFLGSQFVGGKTLTERMLGAAFEDEAPPSPPPWALFNILWVVSLAALGAVNLYVAYRFDEATWVNFKVFGSMGWLVGTIVLQLGWIWLWLKMSSRAQPADDAR